MIRSAGNGKYNVYSEGGKKLGGPYTKSEAIARLRQIEYWKKHKK